MGEGEGGKVAHSQAVSCIRFEVKQVLVINPKMRVPGKLDRSTKNNCRKLFGNKNCYILLKIYHAITNLILYRAARVFKVFSGFTMNTAMKLRTLQEKGFSLNPLPPSDAVRKQKRIF